MKRLTFALMLALTLAPVAAHAVPDSCEQAAKKLGFSMYWNTLCWHDLLISW